MSLNPSCLSKEMVAAPVWDVPLLGQHLHFALRQRCSMEQLGNFCSTTDQRNCNLNMQKKEFDEVCLKEKIPPNFF